MREQPTTPEQGLPSGHAPHHRNGRVECDCGWNSPKGSPVDNFQIYVDHLYPKLGRRARYLTLSWLPWKSKQRTNL